jgi:hypothetical protein
MSQTAVELLVAAEQMGIAAVRGARGRRAFLRNGFTYGQRSS